jgi:hypothetical protein
MGGITRGAYRWVQKFSIRELLLCQPCNNEWLGDQIEGPASQLFKPLIAGAAGTLTPTLQALIGLWCVKTALFMEYKAGRTPSTALMRTLRITKRPPPGSAVWLAGNRSSPILLSPHGLGAPPDRQMVGSGCFSVFVLGHVVAVILISPNPKLKMVFGGPTVTQVWPVQLANTPWPLPHFLLEDEGQVNGFHQMVDNAVQAQLPKGWRMTGTETVVPDPKGPRPHRPRRP